MRIAIPEIDRDKCTGCRDCIDQCLTKAVDLVNDKAVIVRPENCNYCTDCEAFCLPGAIRCPFEIVLVRGKPRKASLKNGGRGKRIPKRQVLVIADEGEAESRSAIEISTELAASLRMAD